jgi:protein-S-isoprenylcysteine O-methyltransferase Ste14
MQMTIFSRFLVIAQLILMPGLMLLGYRGIQENPWLNLLIGASILIWASAIRAMRLNNVRIGLEPGKNSTLCRKGPYHWIRHPMYLAALLFSGAFAIGAGTYFGAGAWFLLVIVLHYKAITEEQIWLKKTPEYADYLKATKRLIPFLF